MKVQPLFIEDGTESLFALHALPSGKPLAHIIYIPPFCEEMNRCRSLMASQTRLLAKNGYSCLLLDLYGTGDSSGELKDASWDVWLNNIKTAITWLNTKQELPIILCGLRLGALLAADFVSRFPNQVSSLVLFQPVTTGKTFLTQIFRQRVAYLMSNNLPPESTKDIRQQLQEGGLIEVGGYTLGGKLTTGIDGCNLSNIESQSLTINWVENIAEQGKALPPGATKVINKLKETGHTVNIFTFSGPAIWQLNERANIDEALHVVDGMEII